MTGFVNIFKAEGMNSTCVVNRLKRLYGVPCGHMGTLDPLAQGVLPVGVGNATRLVDYFLDKRKAYTARFIFGATTDTLDREGELVRGGRIPTAAEIEEVLPRFLGEIAQMPPIYSAKSVGGVKSYKLARKGQSVALTPKTVRIDAFELHARTAEDEFEFTIVCGGGTYIRALARDLSEMLGTKGYMSFLRRDESGVFTKETAVPLDSITPENKESYLIPTDSVLPFPVFESEDMRLLNGMSVPCTQADGLYKFYFNGSFYGLARVADGLVKAEKKLC